MFKGLRGFWRRVKVPVSMWRLRRNLSKAWAPDVERLSRALNLDPTYEGRYPVNKDFPKRRVIDKKTGLRFLRVSSVDWLVFEGSEFLSLEWKLCLDIRKERGIEKVNEEEVDKEIREEIVKAFRRTRIVEENSSVICIRFSTEASVVTVEERKDYNKKKVELYLVRVL